MEFLDLLLNPGVFIGCIVGVGSAALLHWLFPTEDLVLIQALLVVFFAGIGLLLQLKLGEHRSKNE